MNKTKIPWCDYTWNPITGCSPESEGCENCYAAAIAHRFHREWGKPHFEYSRIDQPRSQKQPSKIFVCSTSDLFHEGVDLEWFLAVMKVVQECHWNKFIFCTKRPQNMAEKMNLWTNARTNGHPLPNLWLLTSVENQARANERIPWLLKSPAVVRGISAEPLLGPIELPETCNHKSCNDFGPSRCDHPVCESRLLHWVIAGPETGPKARPCSGLWIRDMFLQCQKNNIAFFDKRSPDPVLNQFVKREYPR